MKPLSVILLLLATVAFAQSDAGRTPASRPRLTEELRRASGETAGHERDATPNGASAGSESVMMAPFGVTGSALPIYTKPLESEPEDHPFTWTDGGTLLRNKGRTFTTEVKFQYNPFLYAPFDKKVDLLKISW